MKLTYDSIDAVPEDSRDSFTEFKDGDATVYMHKDLAEAKRAAFRTQGELTEARNKLTDISGKVDTLTRERDEAKRAKQEKDGNYKDMFEDLQARYDSDTKALQGQVEELTSATREAKKDGIVSKLAAKGTEETRGVLERLVRQDIGFNDDGSPVIMENGKATSKSLEDYEKALPELYPHLVAGVQSNGGSGKGGKTGGPGGAKTMSRSDFNGLDHAQRAEFFKDGGTLTDD